ncbi:MAG TPA: response regulator [archaeon]|nr:response regulator [archaeon]
MADVVYRKKVLSIDDNRQIGSTLRPKFEEAGYQFESAYSGQEGLEKMRTYQPDLVLLDIMMPLMDGHEVLRRIKSDPELKHIPVIMVSAKRDKETVIRTVQGGATDYLVKPVDVKRLLEKVGRVLPTV